MLQAGRKLPAPASVLAATKIRRGVFRSVPQLKAAIQAFIDAHQENPKPFVWTKTADEILASIARFAERTADARAIQLLSRTIGTGHLGLLPKRRKARTVTPAMRFHRLRNGAPGRN